MPLIVTVESSFSGSKLVFLEPSIDLGVEVIEGGLELGARRGSWGGLCEAVSEDSGVDPGEEEGDAKALVGDGVAVAPRDSGDQAVEVKPPQVVGHGAG